ncbi:MAG: BatD family protein [Promethearchaeota archaeon]
MVKMKRIIEKKKIYLNKNVKSNKWQRKLIILNSSKLNIHTKLKLFIKSLIFVSLFTSIFLPLFFNFIPTSARINSNIIDSNVIEDKDKFPNAQIVTGSEIYSEQISAFVGGQYSLIRQSYLTNDSNIYKGFDYNDPAFTDCSLLIAMSNGIMPKLYPSPYGESIFSSKNLIVTKPLFGFLYYEQESSTNTTIYGRSRRALKIIQETFNIEVIELDNQGIEYWFPFVGYYPNWSIILDEITYNVPKDGYWGALDVERLSSESYLNHNHISASIIMFQTMEYLINGINLTEQYFGFSLKNYKLGILEENSINNILGNLLSIMGTDLSGSDVSSLGSFDINSFIHGGSKVLATFLQYEGRLEGIEKSDNNYQFNLYRAINYDAEKNGPLSPSSKVFNGIIGALFTSMDISIYSADIVSWEPEYLNLSSYLIDTLELITFLTNQDINISMIENYSIAISWDKEDCLNRLKTSIIDYVNPSNIINLLLKLIRGAKMSGIPTGILDPIKNLTITYIINSSEPSLQVRKEIKPILLDTGEVQLNVTLINDGNMSAWGIDLLGNYISMSDFIPIPPALRFFIETIHPNMTAEEYLGLNQNPRFLLVDTYGSGFYDTIIPNVLNLSALQIDTEALLSGDFSSIFADSNIDLLSIINFNVLTIYSPQLVDDIINYGWFGATEDDRTYYENLYANPSSIMNPDNWAINPGENYTYTVEDYSLLNYYNYTDFYVFNFTYNPPFEPYLARGVSQSSTNASQAKKYDKQYWKIASEKLGNDNVIDIYFKFSNNSIINLENNSLDKITFALEYLSNITLNNSNIELQFFNFSEGDYGEFETLTSNIDISNHSIIFNAYTKIDDYFDENSNYTSIFRVIITTNESQLLNIDCVNLTASNRQFKIIPQQSAYSLYTTYAEKSNYIIKSNDFTIATKDSPVLIGYSYVSKFNSSAGEINRLYVNIKNNGNSIAENVSIQVPIPGKIKNIGGFSELSNSTLYYNATSIQPNEIISLWCDFYTPNSYYHKNGKIIYTIKYNNISFKANIKFNDLLISAPIDYLWNGTKPFLDEIIISLNTNYTNSDKPYGDAPKIGDKIETNITFYNPNTIPIDDIEIHLSEFSRDFDCLNNDTLIINNLMKGFPQNVSIILNKTTKGGVLFSGVMRINGSQGAILRYGGCSPLILGYRSVSIRKTWSDYDVVSGDKTIVTINVTNNGNVVIENITTNDVLGFPKKGFILYEGALDRVISELEPNKSFIYSYVLINNKQGLYTINPASVKYYYLTEKISFSNEFNIKVRNQWEVNASWILLPAGLTIATTIFLYWWKNRYDLEAAQFERREELMFGTDYRSTAWDKFIIEEHLNQIQQGKPITTKREREEVY